MNTKTITNELFKILKGFGYKIRLFKDDGTTTIASEEATRFFVDNLRVMITADRAEDKIRIGTSNTTKVDELKPLINTIRSLSVKAGVDFEIRQFGKSLTPKDFAHQTVAEAFSPMSGTLKRSYQSNAPRARIKVVHEKAVDEEKRGARSRNIKSIFIETASGERFAMPTNSIHGARAMCNHISLEGSMYDDIGKQIVEVCSELPTLKKTRHFAKQNGMSEQMISMIESRMKYANSTLRSMQSPRGYMKTKDIIKTLPAECSNCNNITEEFGKLEQTTELEEMVTMVKRIRALEDSKKAYGDDALSEKKDKGPSADMMTLAQQAEFTPMSKNQRDYTAATLKFTDARAEVAYKLSELNARVKDTYLSDYLGTLAYKLSSDANVTTDEVKIVSALLKRAKEQNAFGMDHLPQEEPEQFDDESFPDEAELPESKVFEGTIKAAAGYRVRGTGRLDTVLKRAVKAGILESSYVIPVKGKLIESMNNPNKVTLRDVVKVRGTFDSKKLDEAVSLNRSAIRSASDTIFGNNDGKTSIWRKIADALFIRAKALRMGTRQGFELLFDAGLDSEQTNEIRRMAHRVIGGALKQKGIDARKDRGTFIGWTLPLDFNLDKEELVKLQKEMESNLSFKFGDVEESVDVRGHEVSDEQTAHEFERKYKSTTKPTKLSRNKPKAFDEAADDANKER